MKDEDWEHLKCFVPNRFTLKYEHRVGGQDPDAEKATRRAIERTDPGEGYLVTEVSMGTWNKNGPDWEVTVWVTYTKIEEKK